MKLHYVYILKCADDSFYTGETNNLRHRLQEHDNGSNPSSYTFIRRPVELVYYAEFPDYYQALIFEKRIKGWSRAKKEALINENWDKLKLLSVCNNESSHHNMNNNGD